MSKINVKVPVKKVITQLELRKKEILADKAKIEDAAAKFEAAESAWKQKAIDAIVANPKVLSTDFSANGPWSRNGYAKSNIEINIQVSALKIGAYPVDKYEPKFRGHDGSVQEIDQMLRVLNMTDDEYVNATTLKSVSEYL